MQVSMETGVPVLTVFIQGLFSFFSPCILPLLPLYVGYLAGGAKSIQKGGTIHYPRKRILINTLFFVSGISAAFFLLGFGFTSLGRFFESNRLLFARISGIVMILFGLYQFGFLGRTKLLEKEFRLPFRLNKISMGPVTALIFGFTFSFAWTPCVGPILGSVLLMAGSSTSASTAFFLIGIYTLGFVLPFLAMGLFTGTVLSFFKKHQNVVRFTVKAGALLLIGMGIMTLTGFSNSLTGYLSAAPSTNRQKEAKAQGAEENAQAEPAPDFTLTDQFGNTHTLSSYKGKKVFLNFWATWCSPCKNEMPEIQALYEKYEKNEGDVIVLGVAGPDIGQEGSASDITEFLSSNGYTFPVVMDTSGELFSTYGIRAFPTTFMISTDGSVGGYLESAMTMDMMEQIIQQTD